MTAVATQLARIEPVFVLIGIGAKSIRNNPKISTEFVNREIYFDWILNPLNIKNTRLPSENCQIRATGE